MINTYSSDAFYGHKLTGNGFSNPTI